MSEELNLEPAKAFIETLRSEGACHIAAATDDRLIAGAAHHLPGPDPECIHCDDVFGPASMLSELVTEIERLRAVLGSRGAHEEPRLLEMASAHAAGNHYYDRQFRVEGHPVEPFTECPHPDCALVRSAALRGVGAPKEKD